MTAMTAEHGVGGKGGSAAVFVRARAGARGLAGVVETYWYRRSSVVVLKPHGSLTDALAVQLDHKIGQLLERGLVKLIVNLEEVPHATTTGIQVLVCARDEARARGGELILVETPKNLLWIIDRLGITEALQFMWKERHALPVLAAAPGRITG